MQLSPFEANNGHWCYLRLFCLFWGYLRSLSSLGNWGFIWDWSLELVGSPCRRTVAALWPVIVTKIQSQKREKIFWYPTIKFCSVTEVMWLRSIFQCLRIKVGVELQTKQQNRSITSMKRGAENSSQFAVAGHFLL